MNPRKFIDVTASRRLADKALAFAASSDGLSLPPIPRIGPWRGVGWFLASKAGGSLQDGQQPPTTATSLR